MILMLTKKCVRMCKKGVHIDGETYTVGPTV